jgi:CheY-like chemotaxis protein
VSEAGDGFEALQRIDHTPPDLIVLDLMLPGLSGVVVHEEIAGHAATRRIPVVVVTGSTREASEFDVACFLRKPVAPDVLVETVRNCLASHGG